MALRKIEKLDRINKMTEPVMLVERISGQTWKAVTEDGEPVYFGIPDFRVDEVLDDGLWFTFHRDENNRFVFDDKYVDED